MRPPPKHFIVWPKPRNLEELFVGVKRTFELFRRRSNSAPRGGAYLESALEPVNAAEGVRQPAAIYVFRPSASASTSAILLFTRSPIETMPTKRSSTQTGKCRIRRSVIRPSSSSTVSFM